MLFFYVGLVAIIFGILGKFLMETYKLMTTLMFGELEKIGLIIKVLELVDMTMVAQLVWVVALAGVSLFVTTSHFDKKDMKKPDWLDILAGPTMVLNGQIRVFKWPAAAPLLATNRDPVRFEAALTASVSLPHGRRTNRAEALCDRPPALSGGLPTWIVLYDAPGADRKEVKHTVFGDLVRHK